MSLRPALDPVRVEAMLDTAWVGRPFEAVSVLPSTNDTTLARAQAGAQPGLAIAAEAQSAGRGRHGRTFESSAGLGLWCSVLLRPPADPEHAPRLSILSAIAAARAIERETQRRPQLKWPNDVLFGRSKVAGVLVEARSSGRTMFVVAGFGINVHHRREDFSPAIRDGAGSLEEEAGRGLDRNRLAASLFQEIERVIEADDSGGFDLAAEFALRDALQGRDVEVRAGGAAPVAGRSMGLEPDGRLKLRLPGGELRAFRAGEVTLRGR